MSHFNTNLSWWRFNGNSQRFGFFTKVVQLDELTKDFLSAGSLSILVTSWWLQYLYFFKISQNYIKVNCFFYRIILLCLTTFIPLSSRFQPLPALDQIFNGKGYSFGFFTKVVQFDEHSKDFLSSMSWFILVTSWWLQKILFFKKSYKIFYSIKFSQSSFF